MKKNNHRLLNRAIFFRLTASAATFATCSETGKNSKSFTHETREVIVRPLPWRVVWEQFLQLDLENLHEEIEFKIQDEFQARLDFGNAASGNVPAGTLQFRSHF